ncbi:MAG: helix-turn-helix domain-containing protein [Microthrixaceae bacterium]
MFVRRHDREVFAMDRSTVTVEEAAVILGIARSTAYECVHRGELRAIRLGRRLVVPRSVVAEILGSEPCPSPSSSDSELPL